MGMVPWYGHNPQRIRTMTPHDRTFATTSALMFAAFAACTTPNPNYRKPVDGGVDDSGGGGIVSQGLH